MSYYARLKGPRRSRDKFISFSFIYSLRLGAFAGKESELFLSRRGAKAPSYCSRWFFNIYPTSLSMHQNLVNLIYIPAETQNRLHSL